MSRISPPKSKHSLWVLLVEECSHPRQIRRTEPRIEAILEPPQLVKTVEGPLAHTHRLVALPRVIRFRGVIRQFSIEQPLLVKLEIRKRRIIHCQVIGSINSHECGATWAVVES